VRQFEGVNLLVVILLLLLLLILLLSAMLLLLLLLLLLQAHRGWPGKVRCVSLSISDSTSGASVCREGGSEGAGWAWATVSGWQRCAGGKGQRGAAWCWLFQRTPLQRAANLE
jgi:hypothetical protein